MEETSELIIIGGCIAGLNALTVASGYLSAHDRVVLVDSRPRAGGMWVDTYDFVRLHQPHPIFTAGNIAWQLGSRRAIWRAATRCSTTCATASTSRAPKWISRSVSVGSTSTMPRRTAS